MPNLRTANNRQKRATPGRRRGWRHRAAEHNKGRPWVRRKSYMTRFRVKQFMDEVRAYQAEHPERVAEIRRRRAAAAQAKA